MRTARSIALLGLVIAILLSLPKASVAATQRSKSVGSSPKLLLVEPKTNPDLFVWKDTCNVYVVRDIYRVCIAQQESPQPLRHVVHVGDELPMWGGASAKVLLRNATPGLLTRVARSSPYGEQHVRRLQEWIDEATHQGFAVSHGEREEGLSAVAVPVLGRSGTVVAALTLSGPTMRFTDERIDTFVKDLTEVAGRMAERGFDHPLGASF